jgi:hypothetical protein
MRELILHKGLTRTKVLLYTDIEQLPADRFSKVNKYWMLSDELGGSFEDIDRIHITRIALSLHDKDKAKKVLDNLRVLIYNIINEVDPGSLAFACMVHSINGVEVTDLSDENLKKIVKELSEKGLTIETLKKKVKTSEKEFTMN